MMVIIKESQDRIEIHIVVKVQWIIALYHLLVNGQSLIALYKAVVVTLLVIAQLLTILQAFPEARHFLGMMGEGMP